MVVRPCVVGAGLTCIILSRGDYVYLVSEYLGTHAQDTWWTGDWAAERYQPLSRTQLILRAITGNTYSWLGCKGGGMPSNTHDIIKSLFNSITKITDTKIALELSFRIHIDFGIGPLSWLPCFPQFLISPFNDWKPNTRFYPLKFSLARNWEFSDLSS